MEDKMCFTCKHLGKIRLAENTDVIYCKGRSHNKHIQLCYLHSVEFFKLGQTNFLLKYNAQFAGSNYFPEISERKDSLYPFRSL